MYDFLGKGYMPRVSHLSANGRGNNEIIPELCIDPLTFTLRLRKSPKKTRQGERLMKAVRPIIASNRAPVVHGAMEAVAKKNSN